MNKIIDSRFGRLREFASQKFRCFIFIKVLEGLFTRFASQVKGKIKSSCFSLKYVKILFFNSLHTVTGFSVQ